MPNATNHIESLVQFFYNVWNFLGWILKIGIERDDIVALGMGKPGHHSGVLAMVAVEQHANDLARVFIGGGLDHRRRIVATAIVDQDDFAGPPHSIAGRDAAADQLRQVFLLAGDSTPPPPLPRKLPPKTSRVWKEGTRRLGAVRLYDGNLLCLATSSDETTLVTRYGTGLFLLTLIIFVPVAGGIGFFLARRAMGGVRRIAPLIDSILELAQAETGTLVLQNEPFDLAEETRAAHALFSSIAEDRKIHFDCSVPADPVEMQGDRVRMQRVLINLLDNALKFTPENGAVSIVLESDANQAVLTVSDTGCGIGEADLDRVFERFYRAEKSRNAPGNGLGLSLAKAFVQAFGGTVEIDSGKRAGCTASVRLPLLPKNR